jgi:hypothetical protein
MLLMSMPLAAATVRGTVEFDALPAPGVTVTLEAANVAPRKTLTDVTGAFAFENLTGGTYIVRAQLDGLRMAKKPRPVAVMQDDVNVSILMETQRTDCMFVPARPPRQDGPTFTMWQSDAEKLPLGH